MIRSDNLSKLNFLMYLTSFKNSKEKLWIIQIHICNIYFIVLNEANQIKFSRIEKYFIDILLK